MIQAHSRRPASIKQLGRYCRNLTLNSGHAQRSAKLYENLTTTDVDVGASSQPTLLDTLKRIDKRLKKPGVVNSDDIFADIKAIHSSKSCIPLSIAFDTAKMLCSRRDAPRLELLIYICKENWSSFADPPRRRDGLQSVPHHDPVNKLISFCVSGLYRNGETDDAVMLWMQVTSNGYVTSKVGMEKLLDRVVGNPHSKPSLDFIYSLRKAMNQHIWDQNPWYFSRLFRLYYQHLLWVPNSVAEIDKALASVNDLWNNIIDVSPDRPSAISAELHAARLHCFSAALASHRRLALAEADQPQSLDRLQTLQALEERLVSHTTGAFHEMQQQRRRHLHQPHATSDSESRASSVPKQLRTAAQSSSAIIIDRLVHEVGNILASSGSETPVLLVPAIPETDTGRQAAGTIKVDGAWSRSKSRSERRDGAVRRAVSALLGELAARGRHSEALQLLADLLASNHPCTTGTLGEEALHREGQREDTSGDGAGSARAKARFEDLREKIRGRGASSGRRLVEALAERSAITAVSRSIAKLALAAAPTPPGAASESIVGAGFVSDGGNSSLSGAAQRAAFHHQATQHDWHVQLLCDVMRQARGGTGGGAGGGGGADRKDDGAEWAVYQELATVLQQLVGLALQHNLQPGPALYASYVDCLSKNLVSQSRPGLTWEGALAASFIVLDGAEASPSSSLSATSSRTLASSNKVCVSLVNLLCSAAEMDLQPAASAAALHRALELLGQAAVEGEGQRDGEEAWQSRTVPVATLCRVLDAACIGLDARSLSQLVAEVSSALLPQERTGGGAGGGRSKGGAGVAEVQVLRSLIFAQARLGRGFEALRLLSRMRRLGGAGDKRMYRWLAVALYQAAPEGESEWATAKHPASTAEYLLRELKRDGMQLDEDLAVLLLRLFVKAAQIAKAQGGAEAVLQSMDSFLQSCCSSQPRRRGRVRAGELQGVTERLLREVVRAYCAAGLEEQAFHLLHNAEEQFGLKVSSTLCYEPILFNYAGLKGLTVLAEDVLMDAVNRGLPLTDGAVVAMALGHMRRDELVEALDSVLEAYHQHRVRPTVGLWLQLLACSLDRGDVYEARRVAHFIGQLYSVEERRELVGPTDAVLPTSRDSRSGSGVDGQGAMDSLLATGRDLRLGAPLGGRAKGVLSEEHVSRMFSRRGLSLHP